jgi:SAM-dependent methyltransferase
MSKVQDAINGRVYQRPGIDRHYSDDTLWRAEGIALLKYQPAFAGKDVLDIGVGTGRTTIYLAPLARRYQAIDYSTEMVRSFEATFADIPIALTDMRQMAPFPDADFDFVLASNNVFDAVGHDDRLRTLREIHRVLRPGGILMFTSHNRDRKGAAHWPRLEFSRNPITQLLLAGNWCKALANHLRLRRYQVFAEDYAILNDQAHDCSLLHYYIGSAAQGQQLRDLGFGLLDVLDCRGNPVSQGRPPEDCRWLLYVARRIQVS